MADIMPRHHALLKRNVGLEGRSHIELIIFTNVIVLNTRVVPRIRKKLVFLGIESPVGNVESSYKSLFFINNYHFSVMGPEGGKIATRMSQNNDMLKIFQLFFDIE